MTDVRLNPDGLADALTEIFIAAGGSREEARVIAVNLVGANLTGHDSHGVVRTQRYCEWVRDGKVFFDRQLSRIVDAPAFALLEGNMGFGQTLGIEAVAVGLEKAREQGVSVIGLRNVGHLGRIGEWAERAIAEGFVSIHFVNAYKSRLVAPFGGAERSMGTNPVAIGVPCADGDFVLDFATSTVAEGKVLVARRGGKKLPEGALVDADGSLTTNPDALYGPDVPGEVPNAIKGPGAITAMGLHKGSGLALACELLGGALTGSGTCGPGYEFHNGMLSIYVDPERFDDGHDWAAAVKDYVDFVHGLRPRDPAEPVLIPGDPERARRAERSAGPAAAGRGLGVDPDGRRAVGTGSDGPGRDGRAGLIPARRRSRHRVLGRAGGGCERMSYHATGGGDPLCQQMRVALGVQGDRTWQVGQRHDLVAQFRPVFRRGLMSGKTGPGGRIGKPLVLLERLELRIDQIRAPDRAEMPPRIAHGQARQWGAAGLP